MFGILPMAIIFEFISPNQKPFFKMIQTIKVLASIYLSFLTLLVVGFFLIFLFRFYVPAKELLMIPIKLLDLQPKSMPTAFLLAVYLIGYQVVTMLLRFIVYILLLIAIQKKRRRLYVASLIIFGLLTLGRIAHGHIPFIPVLFLILLLTDPARDYFKPAV